MQDYLETLKENDLVIVEGELITTTMGSGAKSGPTNSIRFQVSFLAAMPRSIADRIDQEATQGCREPAPRHRSSSTSTP